MAVIGADSLNAIASKVLRAQVGGVESIVLTAVPSPPRKGLLTAEGPVVLPSIMRYCSDEDEGEGRTRKSPEQMRQQSRAKSRSKRSKSSRAASRYV